MPFPRTACCLITVVLVVAGAGQLAVAQTADNVLVVVNGDSPVSAEIGDYYAQQRRIPADQIVRLHLPLTEEIQRRTYENDLERPVGDWLTAHSLQDRILYIAVVKDVPLRIAGTAGQQGTVASVDSELTLLYRKLAGIEVQPAGRIQNPYFLGDTTATQAERFSHRRHDIYLVTRLDGYSADDVKGLIDRAAAPTRQGRILLDQRFELTRSLGNIWLERADQILTKLDGWAERVELDTGRTILQAQSNVLGYYSWGSNDRAMLTRNPNLQFVPGAIGAMLVSTDGRTFKKPPDDWRVGTTDFAGSSQSLTGDLIRQGITGTAGHVAEPYLNAAIRPDILFPMYVSGFNLAESFYLAMPFLSWQTVVVGDPLCTPFEREPLVAEDSDPEVVPATGMSRFMSARRMAFITGTGVSAEAAALFARAEGVLARQDRPGARELLEQATVLDPTFVPGHLLLATIYEQLSAWEAATVRYQRIIAQAPEHMFALNNIAYVLAAHRDRPAEALPFAKRAYAAGKSMPTVADTLGWVYHLLGDDVAAEPLVVAAAAGDDMNPEIHWHAAVVLSAVGKGAAASRALDRALNLDKALAQNPEVVALRQRLMVR